MLVLVLVVVVVEDVEPGLLPMLSRRDARWPNSLVISVDRTSSSLLSPEDDEEVEDGLMVELPVPVPPDEESSSSCRMRSLCSVTAGDDVAGNVAPALKMLERVVLEVDGVVVTPTLVRMKSQSVSGAAKGDVPSSLLVLVVLFHAPI